MSRKVCVVTGTRAEFGLMRILMSRIKEDSALELQVIATGAHLSPEFGLTYKDIEEAGFVIDRKVEMLLSADSSSAISKSVGLGMIGFADALADLQPDVVVVLGDRFEVLSAASAAMIAKIPIAHLHGGETTEGAFDEAIRHSVTKMAHLHFVAAEEYRRRVIQLGEDPNRVFLVGGLGVDAIDHQKFMTRDELEKSLDFRFGRRNLLITFHPVTLDEESCQQMNELLSALADCPHTHCIFTMPNADTGGRALMQMIDAFVARYPNSRVYTSLGQQRYLSCMRLADAVIGNSSSGLAEAPAMGVPTVNIGDRQKGRLQSASVVNCAPERKSIRAAIDRVLSKEFRESFANSTDPLGNTGASEKVIDIIRRYPLQGILKKSFYDIPILESGIQP